MPGLYQIICQGYPNIYVMADSFDHARTKWLVRYINIDENTGQRITGEDAINPMPDTIAFMADETEVIL